MSTDTNTTSAAYKLLPEPRHAMRYLIEMPCDGAWVAWRYCTHRSDAEFYVSSWKALGYQARIRTAAIATAIGDQL